MQTYHHIINWLTEAQKVKLLTDFDSFTETEMSRAGVPKLTYSHIWQSQSDAFPTPSELTRSWSGELVRAVSTAECAEKRSSGTKLVFLPGAKGAVGTRASSLSEDPLLSGAMAKEYLEGARTAGVAALAQGYDSDSHDNAHRRDGRLFWTRETPSKRLVSEQLYAPFGGLINNSACVGVVAAMGEYLPEGGEKKTFTVRQKASSAETVGAIARGEICLSASASALQRALNTYRRLQSGIAHGKNTGTELDAAVECGEAMSEETLDEALKNLLDFAALCMNEDTDEIKPEDKSELSERAAYASSVLLENRFHTLPITKPTKLCFVGDIPDTDVEGIRELTEKKKHTFVGFARGYERGTDRSNTLLSEVKELASEAEIVVLYLRMEDAENRTLLPAAQLALCDALGRMGKRVVLVISAEHVPDMGFTVSMHTKPDAILLAPTDIVGGALYAARILFGEKSPEGRLGETATDGTLAENDRRRLCTGPFSGYRYYDTVGSGAIYPFGHGLTYTKFKYSALRVSGNKVTFTVTNVGKRSGVEVAQVYVGKQSSAVMRPCKELAGFERVELGPKQKKTVTLTLGELGVLVYDTEKGERCTESGAYTVYVGASVSDIRLKKRTVLRGTQLSPDGEVLCDYLPCATNIFKEHYILEAEFTPMRSTMRNLTYGIIAVLLAIGVKVYDIVSVSNSLFLNIVAAVLAIGAIAMFALEISDRKKKFIEDTERQKKANEVAFKEADEISVPSAEELFADADDIFEDRADGTNAPDAAVVYGEHDYFADVDKSLTFSVAAEELVSLATEKGILLDKQTATSIFAAFATSRLVITKGMSQKNFAAFMTLLGEYFGCPAGLDTVDESYVSEANVLFSGGADYNDHTAKNALLEIQSAKGQWHNIHIVPLDGVTFDKLSDYFVPFAQYTRTPKSINYVNIKNDEGRTLSFEIPENVWFVLNLKAGETLAKIPEYISETATLNYWSIEVTKPASKTPAEFRQFRYGQMLYLCDKISADFALDESTWKKVDRLEAYVMRHSGYRIGNKLWLGLETYLCVLMDSGAQETDALDEAVAAKLLVGIIPALSGRLSKEDRGLIDTLDAVFGDDDTAVCRRVVKDSGVNII